MFFPPDPDSHIEMRMVIAFVGAISRADPWVILFIIFAVLCYAVVEYVFKIVEYIIKLYQEYASRPEPYARYFRITLAVSALVFFVGVILLVQHSTHDIGVAVLCCGFGAFGVVSALLDWEAGRAEQEETLTLEDVTYDDLIMWQNQVNEARDAGLMK